MLAKSLEEGRITHVIALGSDVPDPDKAALLGKAKVLIALATNEGPMSEHATVVLPASSWAESDGTFVNAKGMAQESERAISPQGIAGPLGSWPRRSARPWVMPPTGRSSGTFATP